jgi:hypothetical protein
MSSREALGRSAAMEALRLRTRRGRSGDQPVCPVDLAIEEGLEVRFASISTLEGMYVPDKKLIVVGSQRPRGRRAYSCAHELGHHVFGHGLRLDELIERDAEPTYKDDAEVVADRFAAALTMPKLAVLRAFAARGWDPKRCTAQQAYTIAGFLGVGYTTLIGYIEGTLRILPAAVARELRKTTPKKIRASVLGHDLAPHVIVVDELWQGRPVDAEVGDALIVPAEARPEGLALEQMAARVVQATTPGRAVLQRGAWRVEVRVARAGYTGLAEYRHMEEVDGDV